MAHVSLECSILILIINFLGYVKTDCVLSLNKDFENPGPVFIRNGAFLEANTKSGHIVFGRSETVLVSCPGPKGKIVLRDYTTNYETLEAHCVINTSFRVDRHILNFHEIRCESQPFFIARKSSRLCHRHNHIYDVGYLVKNKLYTLYEACFDEDLVHTHYVKHRLTSMSVFRQNGLKRPSFTEGHLFEKVRMSEIYKIGGQKMALDAILGYKMSEEYLTRNQFLSRGHLAANADYPTSALIRATFHYVNTAPQWMRGNAGDWAALEDGLRRRVHDLGVEVTVFTGTHGVMTLPDREGVMQEIYLHTTKNNSDVPVPMYFYKVVYDPTNKAAAAFISINSSFYNDTTIKSLLFCNNICADSLYKFKWLRWRSNDGTFSFCCEYDQFVKKITYLPKLDVKGTFY